MQDRNIPVQRFVEWAETRISEFYDRRPDRRAPPEPERRRDGVSIADIRWRLRRIDPETASAEEVVFEIGYVAAALRANKIVEDGEANETFLEMLANSPDAKRAA